ncbi:rCG35932 [Rattus norvegicus]|uniref:RCG35932 n=1 Tax=Rattus norvegicus TaxID=10116 RepID=A6IKF0_RAT|nr:rCG35932 [Rattus norvegicus]
MQETPFPAAHSPFLTFSAAPPFLSFSFLFETVSVCGPCCSGTCYVDQASLKLKEILLPLPPEANKRMFESAEAWNIQQSQGLSRSYAQSRLSPGRVTQSIQSAPDPLGC